MNIFHIVAKTSLKPTPIHLKAFSKYQEQNMKGHGLKYLNVTNKTKQTTLFHK
jgi:hypothetical protein